MQWWLGERFRSGWLLKWVRWLASQRYVKSYCRETDFGISSGIAMSTPQTFPMASRAGQGTLPGSSRRTTIRRDAPRPAHIHQI